jgi:hypothetical protein
MGFKSMKSYNAERYAGKFILQNDGDYADVIFLYQSDDDVMIVDSHYIKSADYNGYIQHLEGYCPACNKGLKVQTKMFVPLYVIGAGDNGGEIQFWDRTTKFYPVIHENVFSRYPNPSEFIFRITRHGVAGSRDTKYDITIVAKNSVLSYDDILKQYGGKIPYESVCRSVNADEMTKMLSTSGDSAVVADTYKMPDYQIRPRVDVYNRSATPSEESTPVTEVQTDELGDYTELGEDDDVSFE